MTPPTSKVPENGSLSGDLEQLRELLRAVMPFGKYRGSHLLDLPEAYLVWFQHKGFPPGKLGEQMRSALEIKANGLLGVLAPLRPENRPRNA